MPAPSSNTEKVAFLPAADARYGWMCSTPSPWVWMPKELSNVGIGASHLPQSLMA